MAQSKTSWKKSKSGNPGVRPKVVAEVRALAQGQTEEAINTLTAIMRDMKDRRLPVWLLPTPY